MKELYKALFDVSKQLGPCPMTGKGNFGPYSTIDDVISHTKAPLAEHGLFIIQFYKPGPMLVTRLVHVETGQTLDSEVNLIDVPTAQKLGASTTYERRFSDLALLNLASEGDPDQLHGNTPARPQAFPRATSQGSRAGQYVINFGKKYAGRALNSIPRSEIKNYVAYLERSAKDEGKPMSRNALDLKQAIHELELEEATGGEVVDYAFKDEIPF